MATQQQLDDFNSYLAQNPFGTVPAATADNSIATRIGHQLSDLPSNAINQLVSSFNAIPNTTAAPGNETQPWQVPKPYDIAPATTTGEQWTDLLAGRVAPTLAASLLPFGAISKVGTAAGLGEGTADLVANIGTGTFMSAPEGGDAALHGAVAGGLLGALMPLSRLQRVIPAAALSYLDYHESVSQGAPTDLASKQATTDFILSLLPGQHSWTGSEGEGNATLQNPAQQNGLRLATDQGPIAPVPLDLQPTPINRGARGGIPFNPSSAGFNLDIAPDQSSPIAPPIQSGIPFAPNLGLRLGGQPDIASLQIPPPSESSGLRLQQPEGLRLAQDGSPISPALPTPETIGGLQMGQEPLRLAGSNDATSIDLSQLTPGERGQYDLNPYRESLSDPLRAVTDILPPVGSPRPSGPADIEGGQLTHINGIPIDQLAPSELDVLQNHALNPEVALKQITAKSQSTGFDPFAAINPPNETSTTPADQNLAQPTPSISKPVLPKIPEQTTYGEALKGIGDPVLAKHLDNYLDGPQGPASIPSFTELANHYKSQFPDDPEFNGLLHTIQTLRALKPEDEPIPVALKQNSLKQATELRQKYGDAQAAKSVGLKPSHVMDFMSGENNTGINPHGYGQDGLTMAIADKIDEGTKPNLPSPSGKAKVEVPENPVVSILKDKLNDLQAEHEYHLSQGIPYDSMNGLRTTIKSLQDSIDIASGKSKDITPPLDNFVDPQSGAIKMQKGSRKNSGFVDTHALATISGAVAGGLYGYDKHHDPTEALMWATIGGAAGFGGYKLMEAMARANTRVELKKPAKAFADVKKETIAAAEAVMSKPLKDIAGEDVRSRGGDMSKFLRSMETLVGWNMPPEVKTAWTQAHGAGYAYVELLLNQLRDLHGESTPKDQTVQAASKFIEGKLSNPADIRNFVIKNKGLTEAAWRNIPVKDRPDFVQWSIDSQTPGAKPGDVELFRIPKASRDQLIAAEENLFSDAIHPDDLQYSKTMLQARRSMNALQEMFAESMPEGGLKDKILNSIGQYVTRTYRIFTDPHYRPTDALIDKAMKEEGAYLDNQHIEAAVNTHNAYKANEYNDLVTNLKKSSAVDKVARLDRIKDFVQLNHQGETYYVDPKVKDGYDNLYDDHILRSSVETKLKEYKATQKIYKTGGSSKNTMDTSLLSEREDLSPTYRELLGEFTDPKERILQALNRIYPSAQASRFISITSRLKGEDGLSMVMDKDQWIRESKQLDSAIETAKLGGDQKTIASLQSRRASMNAMVDMPKNLKYGILKDARVSRFVSDELTNYRGPWDMMEAPAGRAISGLNNVVKQTHTKYNPLNILRNYATIPIFLVVGRASVSSTRQAIKSLRFKDAEYVHMLKEGVLGVDQVRGEFQASMHDVFAGHYDSDTAKKARAFDATVSDLYRQPDMIIRAATYLEARSRFASKMDLPIDHPDVISKAVQFTDDRTFNYDNVTPLVKIGRQVPFFNLYISYQAEIARIAKNLFRDGMKGDIHALATLGGVAAIPEILQAISRNNLSPDDKKQWDRAIAMSPDYNRSSYRFVTGKNAKGNFKYIDFTPFVVHDSFARSAKSIAEGDWKALAAVNPVMGWDNTPAWNIISEQVTGKDMRTDRQFRDFTDRVNSFAKEVSPNLTPGIGWEWKKITPPSLGGNLGVTNLRTGKMDDLSDTLKRYGTFGLDFTSLNAGTVIKSAQGDMLSHIATEKAYLNDILKTQGMPPERKQMAVQRYQEAIKMIVAEFTHKLQ